MNTLSPPQKILSQILKWIVILSATIGTFLSWHAGRDSFMGGRTVFMFFTTQSNIALAVICLTGSVKILKDKPFTDLWYIIKFVGTVAITLTGAVFCFVLAPTLGSGAWSIQSILTHVIVPVTSILDFFVTGINSNIKKRNDLWVVVPPILYAIYAGIGYSLNWQFAEGYNYPYFFLNWGSPAGAFGFTDGLPYMGVAWWIAAIFCALLIVGMVYLLLLDVLKKLFILFFI
ncbi:MAG: Pr6Pr family membrane protein [Oscillospiraceae bacterium]|nr:Pr6Pr family membrane protein [Oscillospiraceae bacterium]MBQ8979917.1 Pr6Pr family membrane protein [Oscillospiraceae bacterium]